MEKKRSRRKPGARAYSNYPAELLNVAADLVMCQQLSTYQAEKKFGIPRRTILNRCRNLHNKDVGRPTNLTRDEEKHIADVLNVSADFGSPLTMLDLRIVVYNYLNKNGRGNIFNGKMPGERWARSFLMRHNFSQRATVNIKRCRAAKTVEEMTDFFENLEVSLKNVPPSNIMNFDETNLSDDPGCSKAIFKRGTKHPERVLNSSKSSVSIMFAGTADGKCLPPYVVYKSDHLWTRWCQNGPANTRYNRTKSGWFDMTCFDDWFQTIVLPWASQLKGSKVIIGDNLSSHLSVETIKLCKDNNIRFVLLPCNSTHLTQPLDLAFFGPLKKQWRNILLEYKLSYSGATTINKCHFPQLLLKLMEKIEMNEQNNIKSGFAASGIYPFLPSKVLTKIPQVHEESIKKFDGTLLEYLTESRQSKPLKVARKQKLNITAGKSVSAEDLDRVTTHQKPKLTKRRKILPRVTTQTCNSDIEVLKSTSPDSSENDNDDTEKFDYVAGVNITNSVYSIPRRKLKKERYDTARTSKLCDKNSTKVKLLEDVRFSKENTVFSISKNEPFHSQETLEILGIKSSDYTNIYDTVTKSSEESHDHNKRGRNIKNINKELPDSVNTNITVYGELSSDENADPNKSTKKMKGVTSSAQNEIYDQPIKLVKKKKIRKLHKYVEFANESTSNSDIDISLHTDSDIEDIPSDINYIDLFCTHEPMKQTDKEYTNTGKEKEINKTKIDEIHELNKESLNKTDNKMSNGKNDIKVENKTSQKEAGLKNTNEMVKTKTGGKDRSENNADNIEELLRQKTEQELPNESKGKDVQCISEILHELPFHVGDTVITRYYSYKSWKYYVGVIEHIEIDTKLYTISYFKTVGKKTKNIKFIKPKRVLDKDTVSRCSIVKAVKLKCDSTNVNQYFLSNDEDTVYF